MKKRLFRLFLKLFRSELSEAIEQSITTYYHRTLSDGAYVEREELTIRASKFAFDVNHDIFLGL